MENRPTGRGKNVTGTGKGIRRRGSGLGTGPVGRQDGYAGKTGSSGYQQGGQQGFQQGGQQSGQYRETATRGLGGGKLLIIIVLIVAVLGGSSLFGGNGGILGSLLGGCGGSTGTASGGHSDSSLLSLLGGSMLGGGSGGSGSSGSSDSGVSGDLLSGMLGGFSGGGSTSSGWDRSANTGKLDTSVVSSARAKRTNILGNGKDTFTIMVYMCGTDLESKSGMASNDLAEMAKSNLGKNSNINVIVFTGGCKQWKTTGISNSVNQIYKVENGNLTRLEADFGKDSMIKPATLTSFINYCTKNYPANRQALIFWDHGGGSVSGYGYDEKNARSGSMDLSGINTALKNANTTFDFIGFDACLMATLETGLMLDNYADYMIASEETEPGIGWYYTNWLNKLIADPSMPTIELGKNIVDDFVAECNRRCAGQKTTLSVVDLAELSATVPTSLKDFANGTSKMISGTEYKTVSDARSATREFATSSRIDQVDLVHLCYNLKTAESEALAKSLLGAVKYNKTSSSISNAYGISIYFPYQRTSMVKNAVDTYKAIGLDSAYSRCIQQFANLEVGGQGSSNSGGFDVGNLLGGTSSSSGALSSSGDITDLLSGLLGGGSLFGREIDIETATQTIAANRFDASKLVWTQKDGKTVMDLTEEQWSQVHSLQLNVFYDDGAGYVDLGLDSMYSFTDQGDLVGEYDCTWVAIGDQPVGFYVEDTLLSGNTLITTGRTPILLNGDRANLLLVFEEDLTTGEIKAYIAGARMDYKGGETETVAKENTELQEGDKIDIVCDYYSYEGKYEDSYMIGDQLTYSEELRDQVCYVYLDSPDAAVATYLFTDIYNQEYWTAPMTNTR